MEIPKTIPSDVRNKLKLELNPSEVIRWIQQPLPRFFTTKSTPPVVFSLLFLSVIAVVLALTTGFNPTNILEHSEAPLLIFGLVLTLIALAMLSSPLFYYKASFKTIYAITNERAILIEREWITRIRSYYPTQLLKVYREEKKDGSGDVIIDKEYKEDSEGSQSTKCIGFFTIPNPKEAETLLRELAKEHSS